MPLQGRRRSSHTRRLSGCHSCSPCTRLRCPRGPLLSRSASQAPKANSLVRWTGGGLLSGYSPIDGPCSRTNPRNTNANVQCLREG
ncbi:uncharacterized protein LAESUDRAFT_283403 [Laetiporus sulphureus 93-53]|uniref:Uncharacterized protein n=1 Tax=Laetiporus sulphureus 93-53 TaxID=1314785 RepID=A0A165DFG9_9APHY|nr:uncharacterized protein LAESUDRAFT_283403 [Laetiporus sulphureus 93-53]KZT04780.1 hypothetical protein LAESUDRAFT_283403 [Laetiporus sulphureus 93-53]